MELTKNRSELVRKAADKLGIVGTGQTLEAEEADALDGDVDSLFLELLTEGVCEVTNDDYIPGEWFDSLAGLLANRNAHLGGKNFDPSVKQFYELTLKRLTAARSQYAVQPGEYF